MLYLNKVTNDPQQQIAFKGIPGITINLSLRFMPRVQRWIMDVNYNDVEINGVAIVCSLNLLRQFRNNIPFGICCIRADGLDPYSVNDFSSKASNLYVLDSNDVQLIEIGYFTGSTS